MPANARIDSSNVMIYSLTSHSRLISFLLLLTLLCLLAFYSLNSSGVMRSPGDDEDAGSGFGGTGRQLQPGSGSGLGGTGLRPFLGYNEGYNNSGDANQDMSPGEVQIFLLPEAGIKQLTADVSLPVNSSAPALEFPIPRSIDIAINDPLLEGAGSINITEAIQRDVDISARTINSATLAFPSNNNAPASVNHAATESNDTDAAAEASDLSWARLADALNQNPANSGESDEAQENLDRSNRPRGIQRPVLPPLQRVRPVQRAGLLPPPVRPLRI